MKLSTRGVLIAGATAGVVLILGLVFVFHAGQAPNEPPVAGPPALDDSALSLEERRQARLAQSQAMLGGAKFPSEATVPLPPAAAEPPAPLPPPPSAQPTPPAAKPPTKPVVEPLAAPRGRPCTESGGNSPVAEACLTGGQQAAKQVMKRMVDTARKRGSTFKCESCHVDLDTYKLRDEARGDFLTLMAASK